MKHVSDTPTSIACQADRLSRKALPFVLLLSCVISFYLSWLNYLYKLVKMLSVCLSGWVLTRVAQSAVHTWTCNPACTEVLMNLSGYNTPKTKLAWPTLWIKIARRKKWA